MNRNSELVYVAAWVMSLNEEDSTQFSDDWNPPLEMEQFGFLIGEWEGRGYVAVSDGAIEQECLVNWKAWRMLDGWAIQDEISLVLPDSKTLHRSTLLRTYSSDLGQWKIVEMRFPTQQISEFRAQRVGDSMVMHGQKEDTAGIHRVRFVYYDIYRDSFKVRMESSADGRVWNHAGLRLVLKRK